MKLTCTLCPKEATVVCEPHPDDEGDPLYACDEHKDIVGAGWTVTPLEPKPNLFLVPDA